MLRYVERNPLRANLVARAEQWNWSSTRYWQDKEGPPGYLAVGPVRHPTNWLEWVNQALTADELGAVRGCVNRGTPYLRRRAGVNGTVHRLVLPGEQKKGTGTFPIDYLAAPPVRSPIMPRAARASAGGVCYHVINRGNGQRQVFHKDGDYEAFLKALAHACVEIPLPVLGYCLMPNHFHLVVLPREDGDLSRWMHWVQNTHVRRYHQHYHSSGHIWQGRFRAFPIEEDGHLLTVLRYVERNPLRANLVARAEQWNWSSTRYWQDKEGPPGYLAVGPVRRPTNWLEWVNQALTADELGAVRGCVNRGTPYGRDDWVKRTAQRLHLESSLRPRGRPRKEGGAVTRQK